MKYILTLLILGALGLFGYLLFVQPDTPDASEEDSMSDVMVEEEGGTDTEPPVEASIVGKWVSTEDEQFTRTLYENGGYLDSYTGTPETSTNGTWLTFDATAAPEAFPFSVSEGSQYLQLDSSDEVLYFEIAEVTAESFVLVYLNRGGTLTFTRVLESQ